MEPFILLADTHLGSHSASDAWHEITLRLFKEVVDTAIYYDIKTILHLGDFFDNRKNINVKTLYYTLEIAKLLEENNLHLKIVRGNHDTFYKDSNEVHILQPLFENRNNISIISTEPTAWNNFLLLPWGIDLPEHSNCKYCAGHLEITGFHMNNNFICENGDIATNDLSQFNKVYSGHFHTPSERENIKYIGSPYHLSFNDVNSGPRGYYIIDEDREEFIENKSAPKYIHIFSEDEFTKEKIHGNIVKIIFTKELSTNEINEIVNEAMSFGPQQIVTDYEAIFKNGETSDEETNEEGEEPHEYISTKSNEQILYEYIEKLDLPEHITSKKLISFANMLVNEDS